MEIKLSYEINSDWLRVIAALANTETDKIVVKVDLKDNIVKSKEYYPIELLSEMIDNAIKPKPDYQISSVETTTQKIITILVYKGKNRPYYLIEDNQQKLFVRKNKEIFNLPSEHFLDFLPKDEEYKILDYKYIYGNFNYFEKKYNLMFKKDPDFEKTKLVKNGNLTYTGYCFSEVVNNFIAVTCRKYKGSHIFSKIRRAVFVDLYMGDLISVLEKTLKFVKDFNHTQNVSVDGFPTLIKDYPYELFNKAIVDSFLDQDFIKSKEIFVDLYDDRLIIFSTNNNELIDKKVLLGYFTQFNLINIDNYYKSDEKLVRETSNYRFESLDEIYVVEKIEDTVVKVFTNYNYGKLHIIPEDIKSAIEVTHWLDSKVLNLIKENCENTIPYMAHIFRVKESSIKRSIKRLSEQGYIQQVGNGYFRIL